MLSRMWNAKTLVHCWCKTLLPLQETWFRQGQWTCGGSITSCPSERRLADCPPSNVFMCHFVGTLWAAYLSGFPWSLNLNFLCSLFSLFSHSPALCPNYPLKFHENIHLPYVYNIPRKKHYLDLKCSCNQT